MVRDPIKRILSHWVPRDRRRLRDREPIEDAAPTRDTRPTYTARMYWMQLQPYLELFDREQIEVITQEELQAEREETMRRAFALRRRRRDFTSEQFDREWEKSSAKEGDRYQFMEKLIKLPGFRSFDRNFDRLPESHALDRREGRPRSREAAGAEARAPRATSSRRSAAASREDVAALQQFAGREFAGWKHVLAQLMRIAVAADERVGRRRGRARGAARARPRADRRTAPSPTPSATTGPGPARRPRATSPRAAPSRRSSAAGPAPAPRSRPTRSPGSAPRSAPTPQTAEGARRWNDANVLALSLRATSEAELAEILDAWFAGEPERGGRGPRRTSSTWARSRAEPARRDPCVRRLLPDRGETTVAEQLAELDLATLAHADRPYVALNFAATLDGRAAIDGPLGADRLGHRHRDAAAAAHPGRRGDDRRRHDARRALRADRLRPGVARLARAAPGLAHDPLAVIVCGRLDLPWDAALFTDGGGRVVIFTASDAEPPETATPVERGPPRRTASTWPRRCAHLREERGIRAVLCEGGPDPARRAARGAAWPTSSS